ncbi:MAG TPA: hypothetical protein VLW45_12755 [Pelomicrobium sp.]|nr:hypothetical protein [Pelomicrobium sp.]
MALSLSLRFQSDRFDFTSELPEDYNADNRFYGKDVAEFLAKELIARGFPADYLDEDWGWLVFSARGSEHNFEVAIYNLAEHGEGGRPGVNQWGLWIRAYEQVKTLGFIKRNKEVEVPGNLEAAIRAALESIGATPVPWDDGPG